MDFKIKFYLEIRLFSINILTKSLSFFVFHNNIGRYIYVILSTSSSLAFCGLPVKHEDLMEKGVG